MKLLLTSKSLKNESIKNAFEELVGKRIQDSIITFVVTPALLTPTDKKWFVDELMDIRKYNPQELKLLEFNSVPRQESIARMKSADAVFFAGGSAAGLLHAIEKNDLRNEIEEIAKSKVYCGISASSHIISPDLTFSNPDKIKAYKEMTGFEARKGLNWVDFYMRAHYTPDKYPDINNEFAQKLGTQIYAVDDETALKVVDGQVEVISEGEYTIFE